VLDNVLSQEECDQLIRLAELSAGGHRGNDDVENNGWKPAMVNVGSNYEVLAPDYRNSDRIIWDNAEVTRRLFQRVLQAPGMKEYLLRLDGKKYEPVVGIAAVNEGKRWVSTPQGLNERMRFLKYGARQFFRRKLPPLSVPIPSRAAILICLAAHCDGAYVTPDGSQMTHYTLHLYLNDSAEALGLPEPGPFDTDPRVVDWPGKPAELVRGGATTFYSSDETRRLDVHPKVGRVLIFQHRKLYHAGDEVRAGIK
jgi:hypothetical protein